MPCFGHAQLLDITVVQKSFPAPSSIWWWEGMESLNKHGYSHSSAEEYLENKQKNPHVLKYKHVSALINLQEKRLSCFSFRGWGGNMTSSYKNGFLSWDWIFYIPMQFKPELSRQIQLREEGPCGCMMVLAPPRDAGDYNSISHLLCACIKHRDWSRCLLPSPSSLQRKALLKRKIFFFSFLWKISRQLSPYRINKVYSAWDMVKK